MAFQKFKFRIRVAEDDALFLRPEFFVPGRILTLERALCAAKEMEMRLCEQLMVDSEGFVGVARGTSRCRMGDRNARWIVGASEDFENDICR